MTSRFLVSAAVFAAFAAIGASPSFALSTKECSVKYQAAKSAGTLNGETWNEFRKKECAGADTAAPGATEEKPAAKTEAPKAEKAEEAPVEETTEAPVESAEETTEAPAEEKAE